MTKAYTRTLSESFVGQWLVRRSSPNLVYKCVSVTKKGHRVLAVPFGEHHAIEIKTRKFCIASADDIARNVTDQINSNPPF